MPTRPATAHDVPAITAMFQKYDIVEFGQTDLDPEDVLQFIEDPAGPGLVDEQDGEVLGFAHVGESGDLESAADPGVPDFRSRQAKLLDWCLATAGEQGASSVTHWSGARDDGAAGLLTAQGFAHTRTSWRMRRTAGGDLSSPVWPRDVELRAFVRDRDSEEVNLLARRAFAGAFGSRVRTAEQWERQILGPDGDVICAVVDGALVAFAVVSDRADGGFIPQLAVAPERRGEGLAKALLHSAFHRHDALGLDTTLDVDGENDQASRLYRNAGMQVEKSFRRWDRELTTPVPAARPTAS